MPARDAVTDLRVAELDAGADDYIVKPTDLDEFGASTLLRRADSRAGPAYEWGEVRIVPAARGHLEGEPVPLSARG